MTAPSSARAVLGTLLAAALLHGGARRAVTALVAADEAPEEARALDRVLPRALERIGASLLRVRPAQGQPDDLARKTRTGLALERDLLVVDALSIAATGLSDLVAVDRAGKVHPLRVRGRDTRLRLVCFEAPAGGLVPAPRSGRLPEPGTFVIAAGTVYGERPTASFGIVSATTRFEGRALQTDATIDPSNAGGALVDLEGSLLGVPVLVDRKLGDDSGVSFAVPIARIEPTLDRLRAGDELVPGLLGIALAPEEPALSPSLEGGARIEGLVPDGPAAKAGLESGDVIVRVGPHRIRSIRALLVTLSIPAAGETVTIVALRRGEPRTVRVLLGRRT